MIIVRFLAILIIIVMASVQVALACDSCQAKFQEELLSGIHQSPQSQELKRLLKETNQPLPLKVSDVQDQSQQITSVPLATHSKQIEQKSLFRSLPLTGYVAPGTKPDKKFSIEMTEGEAFIGNGVIYKGFLINGMIPGPTILVDEGDIIELSVVNQGTVPHGLSIHAAYTQTSKHLGKIGPGETKSLVFRATYPGVYLYHCAPGGHAIPMHVLLGQYGMIVVKPKSLSYKMEELLGKKPDVELYLIQHELYSTGKDAIEGKPKYTLFNGKLFRYVEKPLVANPGDFVRIYFLNVGPNLLSTFHIVGIIWDFAYWQGLPDPENLFRGGQTVLAGPSDSWIVDFRAPEDEGDYLILNHAVGPTSRGAIGILKVSKEEKRTEVELADGLKYSEQEMKNYIAKAVRTISPFAIGPDDLSNPWQLPAGEVKAQIQIIGNSFYPKVIEIPVGTQVEWTNEDVFTYFSGEFAGIHNVVAFSGPETFASPMLGHAEKFSHIFTKPGEYNYLCAPHPYMRGLIRVIEKKYLH